MTHTKTPWRITTIAQRNEEDDFLAIGNGNMRVASISNSLGGQEDAEFIVLAVNNHDALVEALELMKRCSPCGDFLSLHSGSFFATSSSYDFLQ